MPSKFTLHLEQMRSKILALDSKIAFAFGTACLERQWPVYRQVSEGKVWERLVLVRTALDRIWGWLVGVSELPQGYREQCDEALALFEEAYEDEATLAWNITGSLLCLTSGIEANDRSASIQVAQNCLDLLQGVVYEQLDLPVTLINNDIVDDQPLMVTEFKRQQADMDLLMSTESYVLKLSRLRERSLAASILK